MSISKKLSSLTAKLEQLVAMLEPLERQGDEAATIFAVATRRRLTALRSEVSIKDDMRLIGRLLDLAPSAKDLDAINFDLDRYPEIEAIRVLIRAEGALIAEPLIDAL